MEFIDEYQGKSLEVFKKFKIKVLDQNYLPGEADIILSTIHAAKGTFDVFSESYVFFSYSY
jgi:hypothetical protein